MNKGLFKTILPHLIALVVFLAITIIFCKPALEGNSLSQHDIVGWKGMSQNAFEYKAKHGHFPLWNPNLFSGMPNYQVAMEGKTVLPNVTEIFGLWLPKPMNFFMIACICFYILCLAFRINTVISILGSIAFAFSTYNPIIIGVGHESKMFAIGYMPLLLAGMIFTFERKYWLGLAITTLGAFAEIAVNHPQINFYFMIIAAAVTIAYAIKWIMEQQWRHLLVSMVIVIVSALIGVAASAVTLLTTSEYAKATMRGGGDISIEGNKVEAKKTSGLDTSYALRWSLAKGETVVTFMPKAFGERSTTSDGHLYTLDEDSHVIQKLEEKNIPEGQAIQFATNQLPRYWGGMADFGETTAGPPYLGIIICLFALIGFVIVKSPARWGLLAATVLGILIAWGKYLPGFNTFLFNHVPLMNKFRAPSMAMVITELTVPVMCVLSLQYLLYRENSREELKTDFRKILYIIGGLFGLLIIMWATMDYSSPVDKGLLSSLQNQQGGDDIGRAVISGMKADRKAMFGGQLLRALAFAVLVIGLLYAYVRNWIKPVVITITLAVISTIELLAIDKDYLNEENYSTDAVTVKKYPVDDQILQDHDPDFRVFSLSGGWTQDSRPSYFYKSIGGYHPAKLRIYQDLVERYFSDSLRENILDMLNTKYIVYTNQQTGEPQGPPVARHPFGPCWLVKNVKIASDPADELQSLDKTNLRDSAIVSNDCKDKIIQPQADSSATIKLTKFEPDTILYSSNSTKPQFAVFSEIYYPYGWNAYLDGKKTSYCKTNYVLRGMPVPAGQHEIKFVFEPASYKKGVTISYIASFLILIIVLGGLFMHWRNSRNIPAKNA